MSMYAFREPHGVRVFWHPRHPHEARVEFYWWSRHCGLTLSTDDEGWGLSLRLPPLALYITLHGFGLWTPTYNTVFTWETPPRTVTLPDNREFDLSISDWTLRCTPWGRSMEWRAADPWWIRGLRLDVRRLVLGKHVYHERDLALVAVEIPMPEGVYPAQAQMKEVTRGYQRWFRHKGLEVWLDIPKGIPHAGKGENSWDCGDDGLFGIGGRTIQDAIMRAQDTVLDKRVRYGDASPDTIARALGHV